MSSSSSSETSGIHCKLTMFDSARYSYPCLVFTNTTHYPKEKSILNAAQVSTKNPQPTDVQLGDNLFFTDFKFFSMVAVSHIC